MKEQERYGRDEVKVQELRRTLMESEPMPLGMRSRIEARLSREHRRLARPSWGGLTSVGALAFVVGSVGDPSRWSAGGVVVLLASVGVYVAGLGVLTRRTE